MIPHTVNKETKEHNAFTVLGAVIRYKQNRGFP